MILVGKPKGQRQLETPWYRFEYNIKMELRAKGWEDVDCIHLAQDRDMLWALVNTLINHYSKHLVVII
jgi:hypothetical protein